MELVYAKFYEGYIDLVKNLSLQEALHTSMVEMKELSEKINEELADYKYADGKWTIRQVIQHILDAERVFIYRANAFARKDETPLPAFDEDLWAAATISSKTSIKILVEELDLLRRSNILFFNSLTDDELYHAGIASNKPINVKALGYIIAGHQKHHTNILKERYLGSL